MNRLQEKFTFLQTREEILAEIEQNTALKQKFSSFTVTEQEDFIKICTGEKGVKILYDPYFKYVFDIDRSKKRLTELISLLLDEEVEIIKVLEHEHISDLSDKNYVILDIVAKLHDGRIVNVECQKDKYKFPGQRAACYSSDLVMRQYHNIKRTNSKSHFSFKDIKKVYTIVFFQSTPPEFLNSDGTYRFVSRQRTMHEEVDQKLNLVQEYVFTCLDIFQDQFQNKSIDSKLDAWLMLLSTDEPERIMELIEKYPEFEEIYRELFMFYANIERGMNMYSEGLAILEENTAIETITERYEEQIEVMGHQLIEKDKYLAEKDTVIASQTAEIAHLKSLLNL